MRGIRAAGVGVGIVLTAAGAVGQEAGRSPAARLGRPQPVVPASAALPDVTVARGQMPPGPVPPPPQMPGYGGFPLVGGQPAPPGPGGLGMPRPLPQGATGPTVTETREQTPTQPVPQQGPGVTFGTPTPLGGPVVTPQPAAQPFPFAAAPPTVIDPFAAVPAPPAPAFHPNPGLETPSYVGAVGPAGLLAGPGRLRADADFLLWWVRAGRLPSLVTTSSPQFNGILGQGDTRTLVGDGSIGDTLHGGGRFGGVYWLGDQQCWGVGGNVWFLGRNGTEFTANTGQFPLLARPFFNLNQGVPFSEVVAGPGLATGAVAVNTDTSLWGAELNLHRNLLTCNPCNRLEMFGGFRYLNLSEGLTITESFVRTPGSDRSIGAPTALAGTVADQFKTENHFWGPQVGFTGELRRGRWFAEGRAAVAMGPVFQTIRVSGAQVIQFENGGAVFPGGLLTQAGTNLGSFGQTKFGVVPEVGFKIGYTLTPRARVAVGYNFLYLNSVLRPGDQIDPGLDVTRIPNFPLPGAIAPVAGNRPAVPFRTTDVFAQGLTFSLQLAW